MRIAALDYGKQRIGVAVATTEVGIAFPAVVLPNDLDQLVRWLQGEGVGRVVVGAPYLLWSEQSEQLEVVKTFAEQLQQRLGVPVELYDERLTTAEAERRLREGAVRRKTRQAVVDAVAAAILLDAYLRAQKSSRPPR
ncbi:MAG: Holliday junction resolvase RuvX [Fimbriimonadales bacterium]